MLYEEETRKVNIIDFEYQSPNPAAFDIAEHFNEYAGLEVIFLNNSFQSIWLFKNFPRFCLISDFQFPPFHIISYKIKLHKIISTGSRFLRARA